MNAVSETLSKLYDSISRNYAYTSLADATHSVPKLSLNTRFVKIGAFILVGLAFLGLSGFFVHSGFQPSPDDVASSLTRLVSVDEHIDWNQFAYVQYVTNSEYLCNSAMLFAKLEQLGCKGKRLMMYPSEWGVPSSAFGAELDANGKLLALSRDSFGVQLQPIEILSRAGHDPTWSESYTKLLAFNQTQFQRVLSLDSDSTVMQCMDELFFMPRAPVAMPRAYWEPSKDHWTLSSQIMLVEPTDLEWARVKHAIDVAPQGQFDMDIVSDMYGHSATILPHRKYDLLSGEFNLRPDNLGRDHSGYLGSPDELWDGAKVYAEAKFVHFSDWPIKKPWLATDENIADRGPVCNGQDCSDRDTWYTIYNDFKKRRSEVCGAELVQLTPHIMAEGHVHNHVERATGT